MLRVVFLAELQLHVSIVLVTVSVDLELLLFLTFVESLGIQTSFLPFVSWPKTNTKKVSINSLGARVLRNAFRATQSEHCSLSELTKKTDRLTQTLDITLWGFRVKMVDVISVRKGMAKRLYLFFSPRSCLLFHQTNYRLISFDVFFHLRLSVANQFELKWTLHQSAQSVCYCSLKEYF